MDAVIYYLLAPYLLAPIQLQSRTKVVGKEEELNNIIAPFHTPYVYVQKRLFVLLLNTPRAPYSMLGHVTTITHKNNLVLSNIDPGAGGDKYKKDKNW